MVTRRVHFHAAAAAFLLTACSGPGSAAAAHPPSATPTFTNGPGFGSAAEPKYLAAEGAGRGARVVLTAPLFDSPGARVPIIVTVHDAPLELPAEALSATSTAGDISDCTAGWRNPAQSTFSRTCYLIAPTEVTHLELTGHAKWSVAGGSSVALASPPVKFRTAGPTSGPVSATDAAKIESCSNPGPAVWLTFDDYVPSTAVAHLLLDVLGRNHARGRFFLNHITPAVRKILTDAGHIVQDHTRDHLAMNVLTDAQIHQQIAGGPSSTPGTPKLLRPPYGAAAEASRVVDLIAKDGYGTCRWTVDTRDWAGYTPEQMGQAVRYGNPFTAPIAAGGVILMHANHFTPDKLQAVIDAVHARGLSLDGP
jgi:peptidoglycan/xylan/chitin deacetylase (PgdA/CDA1 family)